MLDQKETVMVFRIMNAQVMTCLPWITIAHIEGGVFDRSADFYNYSKYLGQFPMLFGGFRPILMVLAVRARLFKLEWCRNHPKIWSGDRFLNILGGDDLREAIICVI